MSIPDSCSKFHIDDLNIKRNRPIYVQNIKVKKKAFYLPFLWANFDNIIVCIIS